MIVDCLVYFFEVYSYYLVCITDDKQGDSHHVVNYQYFVFNKSIYSFQLLRCLFQRVSFKCFASDMISNRTVTDSRSFLGFYKFYSFLAVYIISSV